MSTTITSTKSKRAKSHLGAATKTDEKTTCDALTMTSMKMAERELEVLDELFDAACAGADAAPEDRRSLFVLGERPDQHLGRSAVHTLYVRTE